MNVQKKLLAQLPLVYAVSAMTVEGRTCFLAASEQEGDGSLCLLLDPETGRKDVLWESPGGVMSLIPVPNQEGVFLSIEEFYPVFRSENASVWRNRLTMQEDHVTVSRELLCRLPFVHRITLLQEPDGLYLAAANLCSSKKFVEDWSDPGGVYIGRYGESVKLEKIAGGLTKNHGMFTQKTADGDVLWVGTKEGVSRYWQKNGCWKYETVVRDETSDMWISDIDADGIEEMAVIQGFHGNNARLLKQTAGAWDLKAELPIDFGHVVWTGQILGNSCLITGSRGGDMALKLHHILPEADGYRFETQILEAGVGSTQIAVAECGNGVWICSANHGSGTVDLYTLTV